MKANKAEIAVFVSGGGTNLQALIDAQKSGIIEHGEIKLVVSSNPNAYALERAAKAGIKSVTVSKKEFGSQAAVEEKIIEILEENNIDLIVLAGYMSILSADFTRRYERRIINVHPSLIPSFCGEGFYGLRVHEAALKKRSQSDGRNGSFRQRDTRRRRNNHAEGGQSQGRRHARNAPEKSHAPRRMENTPGGGGKNIGRNSPKKSGGKIMDIYAVNDIAKLIEGNSYVGRGIVIGKSADGKKACTAYFIMGRSANSRNRIFTERGGVLYTEPFDASKVEDPSLIIYAAVRNYENKIIVTNGDQTDTINDALKSGGSFKSALETREFEPDAPNFTPRISGMLTFENKDFTYEMSILKSADAAGSACNRYTFSYSPLAGLGHFIHTYVCDGNPIPTFQGEPERVAIPNDIDEFTQSLWNALDADNKISLYVRYTNLVTGAEDSRLINKNA